MGGATGIKEAFPEPALPLGVSAPGHEPGSIFPGERVAPLLAMAKDLSMGQCLFFLPPNPAFFGKARVPSCCPKPPMAPLHQSLPSSAACTGLKMVETFSRLSCDEVVDGNVGR